MWCNSKDGSIHWGTSRDLRESVLAMSCRTPVIKLWVWRFLCLVIFCRKQVHKYRGFCPHTMDKPHYWILKAGICSHDGPWERRWSGILYPSCRHIGLPHLGSTHCGCSEAYCLGFLRPSICCRWTHDLKGLFGVSFRFGLKNSSVFLKHTWDRMTWNSTVQRIHLPVLLQTGWLTA